tara:strand:+ start:6926 stop:7240 length:315 start_codon:yes stop_codon:yes gene_type:complete
MNIKNIVDLLKNIFSFTGGYAEATPTKEKSPKCIVSAYDLRHPEHLEEKLTSSGFDLSGWVEITEIKEASVWVYHQTQPPKTIPDLTVQNTRNYSIGGEPALRG